MLGRLGVRGQGSGFSVQGLEFWVLGLSFGLGFIGFFQLWFRFFWLPGLIIGSWRSEKS